MGEKRQEQNFEFSSGVRTDDYQLVLINDDVNTFEYVVETLVKVCQFDYERAEQCTLITHIKGAYPIMSGERSDLEKIQYQLAIRNIHSKLEKK
ncbi:MAG: hypothetical protein KatS3mg027_1292 [Bacteroidia bacterium]|nr:MAG: hypothetical protein KatS3mg027_1292 [Bacteroidia bacterium]